MNASFFLNNRYSLAKAINGGIAVFAAHTNIQRSNDAAHKFHQEANFWYLCGIEEAGWILIIDGTRGHSWLVAPERDDVHITFDGGLTFEEAKAISGVEEVIPQSELEGLLRRIAKKHPVAHTVGIPPHAEHFDFELNPSTERCKAMLERIFPKVQDCRKELAALRAIKQPEELNMIQKAVDITVASFKSIHDSMSLYKHEYEIEADFVHSIRKAGAQGLAYDSIVAVGINACTLHYSKNEDKIKNRQLVLMDMGAQYGGYAADITRTYAKGEPTKRQQRIHAAVEAAHHKIIALIEPMLPVESYQQSVDDIMRDALRSIGLPDTEEALRRYFPHAVSHGLGIDVHDSLGRPKYFQPNMVLTVEPGIYIPEEGIGVRIEDDILVTQTGHRNLSSALPTSL